jgi:cell division septation protein DedD
VAWDIGRWWLVDASKQKSEVRWPHALTLVLVAEEPGQQQWAIDAAIEVARRLAEHRKVVLAEARKQAPTLAGILGADEEQGIVDVLFRGVSFSSAASRPGPEKFFFLPLGESAPPFEVLYRHPRWQRIAQRLPEAGAHLLTCVSAEDWLDAGPIPGFESCIVINGSGTEIELPMGARRFAEFLAPPAVRDAAEAYGVPDESAAAAVEPVAEAEPVEPGLGEITADRLAEAAAAALDVGAASEVTVPMTPRPTAESAAEAAASDAGFGGVLINGSQSEPERSSWQGMVTTMPQLGSTGRRLASAAGLVAAVVVIAVVWTALRSGEAPEEANLFQAVAETTAIPETTTVPETTADPGTVPPSSDENEAGARPDEVSLPYSVAIASYSAFDDALDRQRKLTRSELPVYVAPTPVRGVIYYRVFAGLLSERSQAEELMAELVRDGVKEAAGVWDVRQVPYAFSFGTYADDEGARARVESLIELGIHAYTVSAPGGVGEGRVAYRVYAGGYESSDAAEPLREKIEEAGLNAELVERVGLVLQ